MPSAQDRFFGWHEMSGGENEYDAPDYSAESPLSVNSGNVLNVEERHRRIEPWLRKYR